MERPIKEGPFEVVAIADLAGKEQRLVAIVANGKDNRVAVAGALVASLARTPAEAVAVLLQGDVKGTPVKVYPLHRGAAVRVELGADMPVPGAVTLGEDGTIIPIPETPGKYAVLGSTEEPGSKGECPYFRPGLSFHFVEVAAVKEKEPKTA